MKTILNTLKKIKGGCTILLVRFSAILPDKMALKMLFRIYIGTNLDINNPKTYSEKIQWFKLYGLKPEYTMMVDKYLVKDYVASIIGDEYIIPNYGAWEHFDDIDFGKLPNQFVLKTNHDSGGIVICTDKNNFDKEKAKLKLDKSLKRNYGRLYREKQYSKVHRKILAEKFLVDESGCDLKDYKFFCFNGKVAMLFIAANRFNQEETSFDFFDRDFNHLPIIYGHPHSKTPIKKPSSFDKMISLAEKLSKGMPQVRIDFYDVNGQVYFGELTFTSNSGLVPILPVEWDRYMGDLFKLPNKN